MTETPGGKILKIVGIIMMVFGALGILGAIINFTQLGSPMVRMGLNMLGMSVAPLVISYIIGILSSAFSLFAGFTAFKNCEDLDKAETLKMYGIVAAGFVVVNAILGFILLPSAFIGGMMIISMIVGLVLPALYIFGAMKNIEAKGK